MKHYACTHMLRFLSRSLIICSFLIPASLHAQEFGQVYLKGRQFMLNGQPFNPIAMNYQLTFIKNGSNYYLSPEASYNINVPIPQCECANVAACSTQIQIDFNYLATRGFNTVRTTFYPIFVDETSSQLRIEFTNHPGDWQSTKFYMNVNPSNPTDPGMLNLFAFYDKILEIANNTYREVSEGSFVSQPMKVIFLMQGKKIDLNASQVTTLNNFYHALSTHLSSCANKNAMLAYDLYNEPLGHVKIKKTKTQACNIVSGWYDIIKSHDPNHLITLGGNGHEDVMSFDPAVLKLDFYSLHTYPTFKYFENRTQSAVQDRAKKRVLVDMHWLDRTLGMPWIIGETGFSAANGYTVAQGLDGTELNQWSYNGTILPGCFTCGGSGFSWWAFQDVHYYDPGPSYKHNFYGLLEWDKPSQQGYEKMLGVQFPSFVPGPPGNCTSEYTSTYSDSKLYYNRFNYPSNPSKAIYGYVKDYNNDPIVDAVVYAHVYLYTVIIDDDNDGQVDDPVEIEDGVYTFTDQNGYFKINPYYYTTNVGTPPGSPPSNWGVSSVEVSAPAAERKVFGCSGCTNMGTLTLQHEDNNITNVSGVTIGNGMSGYYAGKRSLSITNTNVNVGGTAQFYSVREINITGPFTANTNVKIGCDPLWPTCSVYSGYAMQKQGGLPFTADNDSTEVREDVKEEASETSVSIFPNPAGQSTTIRLNGSSDKVINDITVFDLLGHAIYSRQVGSASVTVDVSGFPKGVYLIQVNDPGKTHFQKISIY